MEIWVHFFFITAIPILVAVTLHEAAHAWMADKKGDDTAKELGRLTFNPLPHIDPFGTIIMPLVLYVTTQTLFGYAKPVPVNTARLRRPAQDMAWIAAAGPLMNLLIAVASGLLYRGLISLNPNAYLSLEMNHFSGAVNADTSVLTPLLMMLHTSVIVNIVLFVFNLIPIPPLDGGRVIVGLLPESPANFIRRFEPYGMAIIMLMVFFDPFHVMQKTIWPITRAFSNYIFGEFII